MSDVLSDSQEATNGLGFFNQDVNRFCFFVCLFADEG